MAWAQTITTAWKEREAVIQIIKDNDGLTSEEAAQLTDYVGVSIGDKREILIYDDFYGYAKYSISLSGSTDGALTLNYNSEGLDSLGTGSSTLSKSGQYSSTIGALPSGTALQGSYGVSMDSTQVTGLSTKLSTETGQTEFGIKYVNHSLASYQKSSTLADASLAGSTATVTASYEQGKYLRNDGGLDWEERKRIQDEHAKTVIKYAGVTVGVVTIGIVAWPMIATLSSAAAITPTLIKGGVAISTLVTSLMSIIGGDE